MTTPSQTPNSNQEEPPGTALGLAAVVLSYFVPGMGHLCVGKKKRGLLFFFTIHGLFALGLLLAGIRAISPSEQPIWSITQYLAGWPTLVMAPMAKKVEARMADEVRDYVREYDSAFAAMNLEYPRGGRVTHDGDMLAEADPAFSAAERADVKSRRMKFATEYNAKHGTITYSPKMFDVGAVYCGIAGMLNLLVMFDVLLLVTGNLRHPKNEEKEEKKTQSAGAA